MKFRYLTFLVILISRITFCQIDYKHAIGVDILQLPSSTINVNYSFVAKPFISFNTDLGYVIDHLAFDKYDIQSLFIKTPEECTGGIFSVDRNSGFYSKTGVRINLLNDFQKNSFFLTGFHFIYSRAKERINYPEYIINDQVYSPSPAYRITNAFGIITSLGYEFKLTKRFNVLTEMQLAIPKKNYRSSYCTKLYLPGMGLSTRDTKAIPMLKIEFLYKIRPKNAS